MPLSDADSTGRKQPNLPSEAGSPGAHAAPADTSTRADPVGGGGAAARGAAVGAIAVIVVLALLGGILWRVRKRSGIVATKLSF